jgi:hypothetical protein
MKPLDGRGERHPKTRSLSYSEPSDAVENVYDTSTQKAKSRGKSAPRPLGSLTP